MNLQDFVDTLKGLSSEISGEAQNIQSGQKRHQSTGLPLKNYRLAFFKILFMPPQSYNMRKTIYRKCSLP